MLMVLLANDILQGVICLYFDLQILHMMAVRITDQ